MQLVSNGVKTVHKASTEGTKIAVTYGQPVLEGFASLAALAAEWAAKNPGSAASTAAGIAVIAAPGLVVAPTLSILGFGPGGVQACSLAASAQGVVGNVAAGSTFATLQSAGAGGAGLAVIDGVVQAGVLAVGVGNVGLARVRARL
ncbi:uncharacterized protein BDW70DRAFT_14433 [Aspergillus foveolatus]|uniref:uncharacterized protein n=1 Tax=Aspergillus foveolatus TaxID=210207 RepID=UPI003CCD8971